MKKSLCKQDRKSHKEHILVKKLRLAAEEYGDEIDETVYLATLIADKEVSELIDSYFEEKTEETNE